MYYKSVSVNKRVIFVSVGKDHAYKHICKILHARVKIIMLCMLYSKYTSGSLQNDSTDHKKNEMRIKI